MTLLAPRRAVVVFLAFAFAYFFAAWLRAITAALSPMLTQEFHLDAGHLGLLAGGYFLGFAVMQLPLGAWLDRHGPKKVSLAFLCVAVVGCAVFALARDFATLLAARVLCGAGVSACLMAALTGYRRWFTPGTQLRTNSWMLMTGSLGMLAATLPVQWLVPVVGWRSLFWGLAGLILIAMAVIAATVPAWHAQGSHPAVPRVPDLSYADVWKHPTFRRLAPLGFFNYGGFIAVQSLWAGPWMIRVSGYSPLQAATGLFVINGCMLLTFWTWGLVSPVLVRRGLSAERLIACGQPASFLVLASLVAAGPEAGAGMLAAFCVSSSFMSLAQPAVAIVFPAAQAGRALSAFNLVIFLGVFLVQWGIGLIVDAAQLAELREADAFRVAFAVYLFTSVIAYAWFLRASADNRTQNP